MLCGIHLICECFSSGVDCVIVGLVSCHSDRGEQGWCPGLRCKDRVWSTWSIVVRFYISQNCHFDVLCNYVL